MGAGRRKKSNGKFRLFLPRVPFVLCWGYLTVQALPGCEPTREALLRLSVFDKRMAPLFENVWIEMESSEVHTVNTSGNSMGLPDSWPDLEARCYQVPKGSFIFVRTEEMAKAGITGPSLFFVVAKCFGGKNGQHTFFARNDKPNKNLSYWSNPIYPSNFPYTLMLRD
jgi:hypothetical protein